MADQLDGAGTAAGLTGQVRRSCRMVAQPAQARTYGWQVAAEAPDPLAMALAQRPSHAMDETDTRPLPGVVEQTRHQQIGVFHARRPQIRDDVQPVPAIGHVHPVEESELPRRQPASQLLTLGYRYRGVRVGPRSADLGRPPLSCQCLQLASKGTPARKFTIGTSTGMMIRHARNTTTSSSIRPY